MSQDISFLLLYIISPSKCWTLKALLLQVSTLKYAPPSIEYLVSNKHYISKRGGY